MITTYKLSNTEEARNLVKEKLSKYFENVSVSSSSLNYSTGYSLTCSNPDGLSFSTFIPRDEYDQYMYKFTVRNNQYTYRAEAMYMLECTYGSRRGYISHIVESDKGLLLKLVSIDNYEKIDIDAAAYMIGITKTEKGETLILPSLDLKNLPANANPFTASSLNKSYSYSTKLSYPRYVLSPIFIVCANDIDYTTNICWCECVSDPELTNFGRYIDTDIECYRSLGCILMD